MKRPVTYLQFKKKIKDFRRPPSLKHGLANGMRPEEFNLRELYKGYKVELEHTKGFNTAVAIAMDHLAEFKLYYVYLEKMEKELERIEKRLNVSS